MDFEASNVPTDDEERDELDGPLGDLSKLYLDWLEQCDPLDREHLRVAIIAVERATKAHPVVPLSLMPHDHCIARLLRLLGRTYRLLESAGIKAPVSSV